MNALTCNTRGRSPPAVLLAGLLAVVSSSPVAAAQSAELPLDIEGPAVPVPWQRYSDWPDSDWSSFNTVADQGRSPPVGPRISVSQPIAGDPATGRELALDRKRGGSCVACHIMPDAELPGNVGPDLSTIATWGRSDEWLYNYVYDPRTSNPNSVMPPWGTHQLFTPEEIRDIVAYLKTLDTATKFSNPLDDPARRSKDEPERDNLDPLDNPGMATLEEGEALFGRAGPTGKSCADCHENPAGAFSSWAAHMPRFEPRLNKVMNVAEFVTRHARATTGDELLMQSPGNLALSMFLAHQANGQPIEVDVESPGAKQAAQRGKTLMERGKIGQLNFACFDCHVSAGNKWIRGQFLTPHQTQLGWHPYYRTSKAEIWDLSKRIQWCGVAIRANELPPDAPEYGDIELYLAHLNRGRTLNVPGIGH